MRGECANGHSYCQAIYLPLVPILNVINGRLKQKYYCEKILIIEDEKILREMYQEKFSNVGFTVVAAKDAEDGLDAARKEKPDLILLDILLPKENGIFFLRERIKCPEIKTIPVVAFSNLDDPKIKKQARELDATDYLIKTDYTPQELVKKLKGYLKIQ